MTGPCEFQPGGNGTSENDATLLLVAHGTRDPRGGRVIRQLAHTAGSRLGVPVRTANVDVVGPTVAEALRGVNGRVVAVPAFLASGYHVRTDLPGQLAESAHEAEVRVTDPLGPAPELARVMLHRLWEVGWRPGEPVVFAAAGSSDEHALGDVDRAAGLLGELVRPQGEPLPATYITSARPRTSEVCARGGGGEFLAPYLLAPGLFHRWLREMPSRAVAGTLGGHSEVAGLIVRRYLETCRGGPARAAMGPTA
ncbi:Sirohydrochlorin ferrochelatase [Actinopolyspora mzabensis]|uniref:Sirohydrochlorin ferrochelatase n=1 Tax=Actinopolyspora mzabensis TaxID=995066 RepID=A0A1G9EWT4_ACTMZ|nr:sirohydrochlorin chelatase [Actinopolyspora mzabensis]SDK80570.1 Sirohydrochlorin ferrochelatase [Actinopolyspora mzabensis]